MKIAVKEKRARTVPVMKAARAAADAINKKIHRSGFELLTLDVILNSMGYVPITQRPHAKRRCGRFADVLKKVLREENNLCVVPVNEDAFAYSAKEIATAFSVEQCKAFCGGTTIGMHIAYAKDGNLFVAYEKENHRRFIMPRLIASSKRIEEARKNERLTAAANRALQPERWGTTKYLLEGEG
jgi:hypothetical protein